MPNPADEELLAATAVSKRFGGVRAVEDVSISVRRGDVYFAFISSSSFLIAAISPTPRKISPE